VLDSTALAAMGAAAETVRFFRLCASFKLPWYSTIFLGLVHGLHFLLARSA
jgi:hypothetical protein